jgi:hypothetical protein
MTPDQIQMLFVIMLGLTVVGFMIAINSRGPVKMAFSYVLATAMLIVSVYEVVNYFGENRLREQMQQAQTMEAARKREEQEEMERRRLEAEKNNMSQTSATLKGIALRGKEIARSLTTVDIHNESIDINQYFEISASAISKANSVMSELKNTPKPADGYMQTFQTLEKALNQTILSAKYLSLFFKADDENQEASRERAFNSNAREAIALFDQASLFAESKK